MQQKEKKNVNLQFYLTLILLEPKVISLCHQYGARPACSLTRLYTVVLPTSNFHPNIPINDNGQF